MELYLAGLASSNRMIDFVAEYNKNKQDNPIGVMCTYAMPKLFEKMIKRDENWRIFLDSGAFTVWQSDGKIDIDSYADFLKEYGDYIRYAITLDVIGEPVGTLKNWDYLVNKKGVDVVPVYHANSPDEYLDIYCEKADLVCYGGVAGKTIGWKELVLSFERLFQLKPNHKFHALGGNNLRVINRFPFFSCDALTWRNGSRFGQLVTPEGRFHLGQRRARLNPSQVKSFGVDKWLNKYNLPYPLPEDFDYVKIDELNIEVLYEEIVLKHEEGIPSLSVSNSVF